MNTTGPIAFDDLADALDGLFAYDTGSHDSGIKDERLRTRCRDYIGSLPDDEARVLLARVAVRLWLSEDAVANGYGLEDCRAFAEWVYDDNFGGSPS